MKISSARAIARFLGFLHKLRLLSADSCDKLIDRLTVAVLEADLSKRHPKEYLTEDFNGDQLNAHKE